MPQFVVVHQYGFLGQGEFGSSNFSIAKIQVQGQGEGRLPFHGHSSLSPSRQDRAANATIVRIVQSGDNSVSCEVGWI